MATAASLMASGVPGLVAQQIGATQGVSLTANSTTKATATVLVNTANFFGTVASTGAAQLPAVASSPQIVIYNGGANALIVFAAGTTETINALTAGAGFSVTNGKSAIFTPGETRWVATLSA